MMASREPGAELSQSSRWISIVKDPTGYRIVKQPPDVRVTFDGPVVNVEDIATGEVLDGVKFQTVCSFRGEPASSAEGSISAEDSGRPTAPPLPAAPAAGYVPGVTPQEIGSISGDVPTRSRPPTC